MDLVNLNNIINMKAWMFVIQSHLNGWTDMEERLRERLKSVIAY